MQYLVKTNTFQFIYYNDIKYINDTFIENLLIKKKYNIY